MLQKIGCREKLALDEWTESIFSRFPNKYASFKTFRKKIDKHVQIRAGGAGFLCLDVKFVWLPPAGHLINELITLYTYVANNLDIFPPA